MWVAAHHTGVRPCRGPGGRLLLGLCRYSRKVACTLTSRPSMVQLAASCPLLVCTRATLSTVGRWAAMSACLPAVKRHLLKSASRGLTAAAAQLGRGQHGCAVKHAF